MYGYYRFNLGRSFVVLLKEFIDRVERDTFLSGFIIPPPNIEHAKGSYMLDI